MVAAAPKIDGWAFKGSGERTLSTKIEPFTANHGGIGDQNGSIGE